MAERDKGEAGRDGDVVAGPPEAELGELQGLVSDAVLAKDLGLGAPRPGLTSLPVVGVVVVGAVGAAVLLNMASCAKYVLLPDEAASGYCSIISRQVSRKYEGPFELVASAFVLDLVLVCVVLGVIWTILWEWIGRHGLPFSVALAMSGDKFSGEKLIVRKEVRLKRDMALQLNEDEVPHGSGVYNFAEGHAMTGTWEKGFLSGHGQFQHADGDRYVGEFEGGLPGGKGTYTWQDGTVYEGEFVRGKPHGRGVKTWPDGDRYEGEWARGRPDGQGVYQWAAGRRYEGQWRDGKMDGVGKCEFVNGDVYEGHWRQDKKHGKGTYTWSDGTSHEGEW